MAYKDEDFILSLMRYKHTQGSQLMIQRFVPVFLFFDLTLRLNL